MIQFIITGAAAILLTLTGCKTTSQKKLSRVYPLLILEISKIAMVALSNTISSR